MGQRGPSYSSAVLEYFTKSPGEILYTSDITKNLNLTKDQVQSAISRFKNRKGINFEVISAGHAYRYQPGPAEEKKTGNRVFEEIGVTKKGDIIIQDSDGNLYRAEEL